jgi:hypothetical protein
MKHALWILALAAALPAPAPAQQVAGTWKWSWTDAAGTEHRRALKIRTAAAGLTGTYVGDDGKDIPLKSIVLTGNKLRVAVDVPREGAVASIVLEGTVGDKTIDGEISVGGNTYPWKPTLAPPPAPIAGTYRWTRADDGGTERPRTLTIRRSGDKLTGTLKVEEYGEGKATEIKADGDTLRVVVEAEFGGQTVSLTYEGKFTDKNRTKIEGELSVAGTTLPWNATFEPYGAAAVGTWRWSYKDANEQDHPVTMTLRVEDDALVGTVSADEREFPVKAAELDGDQLKFQLEVPLQDQTLQLVFSGTLKGDAIEGSVQINENNLPWNPKRDPKK